MAIAPHLASKCSGLKHLSISGIRNLGYKFLHFLCESMTPTENNNSHDEKEKEETKHQNLPFLIELKAVQQWPWPFIETIQHFLDHREVA